MTLNQFYTILSAIHMFGLLILASLAGSNYAAALAISIAMGAFAIYLFHLTKSIKQLIAKENMYK